MRSLVVYNENNDLNQLEILENGEFKIQGEIIKCALIRDKLPDFNLDNFPNHVLVQKKAFSCNYRDIAIMLMNKNEATHMGTTIPFGSEFSGVVIDKGKSVKNLQLEDRVIPNGNYPNNPQEPSIIGLPTNKASLEFELFHKSQLIKMPENMSLEEGAGFTIGAQTAFSMKKKLNIKRKQKGLILGFPSNTALFAYNILKSRELDLYIGSRRPVDYKYDIPYEKSLIISDDVKRLSQIDKIYEEIKIYGKFDFIIDPFADNNLFRIIDLMGMNSKYVTCGIANQFSTQQHSIDATDFFSKIIMKNLTIIGNCLGSTADLQKALREFEMGNFEVPIGAIVNNLNEFMSLTFTKKIVPGKIIFKYL
ncbi:hypothetical protein KO02_01505 [Sphingobacterium sp. ML3W]|uniref:alcohol dehydrogenase catalytic domain-containing protein n=1 Tax=Sphingobacterium sp. ML3W TaxID=1538644 RepID=UPI0004F66C33|nr:alcohol dehydrogenase catalytic domain-containing protein [Sphingobacterium sp. ML3W]AIM35481.1 hypothetical protein KO02_01505 [Sphingobacterium sp. ML3W]